MHFTKEDFEKIERYLKSKAVKDSDFQEALPLKGNETVSIIQEGFNRKIPISSLVEEFLNIGVDDFINVTNSYNAINVTLTEAITCIPQHLRKRGQVITFLNDKGYWEIVQFVGTLIQWNNPELWNSVFDWKKFTVDSVLPDNEDLTISSEDENNNSYISLKNRDYSPENFSGLGKIIVRKNIKEVNNPIYGLSVKNVLAQADIAKENTIYEIRYDFDLNGETIVIPNNCTLDFQGGTITNGVLVFNNTKVLPNSCIISDYITTAVTGSYVKGQCLFDEVIGKPKYWTGSMWVDALGQEII